jgi:hypothetical protein
VAYNSSTQEDCEFEARLGYIAKSSLPNAGITGVCHYIWQKLLENKRTCSHTSLGL